MLLAIDLENFILICQEGSGACQHPNTCTNTELNKEGCTEKDITLPTGRKARSHEICDNKCDDDQCEDEGFCHGYTYGIFCVNRWSKTNKLTYVPPEDICDGEEDVKMEKMKKIVKLQKKQRVPVDTSEPGRWYVFIITLDVQG